MIHEEQPLAGGNVSTVTRIGDRVHRQVSPWSSSVHELLIYLESRGFGSAPRFLGLDPQGREILTFIEGEVGNDPLKPYMWADEVIVEMGRLLRKYHDLTAAFVGQSKTNLWQIIYPDASRYEVICHNDVAPYNTVYVDGKPVAFIDFDTAGPGPRIWDIAYALYRFVPLSRLTPDGDGELVSYNAAEHADERRKRIKLFCQAYGLSGQGQIPPMLEERLTALCTLIKERAKEGNTAFQNMIAEGHLDHYYADIDFHKNHFKEYFEG